MVIKKKRVEIRAIYILLIFAILFLAISPIMSKADDPTMLLSFKDEKVYQSVVNKCTQDGITLLSNDPSTKTITLVNSQLARITELTVDGLNGNTVSEIDISDIGLLNYVTKLTITNASIDLSKLSNVTSSNVTDLAITNSTLTNQENLSVLTNLTHLDLSNDGITDLSSISNLTTKLKYLNISYNPIGNNISQITTLTHLISLRATSAGITSLASFVPQMTGLKQLNVDTNATTDDNPNTFTDINQLANLTRLEMLKLGLTSVDSLETIVQLPLTFLSMKNCNIDDNKAAQLSQLTTLTSLDLGNKAENGHKVEEKMNEISSVEPFENLTNLEYLNIQNNQIVNVEPISNLTNLKELHLNGNKIGDVSSLNSMLQRIKADESGVFDLRYQIAEGKTKTGVIDFPEIFTNEILKEEYNITTPGRYTTENCTISNNKITLNTTASNGTVELLNSDDKTIQIFHIKRDSEAPNIDRITTDPAQDVITNGTVKVKVEVNEEVQEVEGWELSYNKKVLTKEYSNNVVNETITVTDLAGNTKSGTFSIQNIDKDLPIVKVTYDPAEGVTKQVVVTIQSQPLDEEDPTTAKQLAPLDGWTLSDDKLTLTKTFTNNTDGIETLTIKDTVGNEIQQDINVQNIDNSLPILDSVTTTPETPAQTVSVTLTFNEKIQDVEGWTKSNDYSISKQYNDESVNNVEQSVEIKDLVGNQATCKFTINNIDRTAPIVEEVTYEPPIGSANNVTATIKLNENVQAPSGWTLGDDLKSVHKDFNTNTQLTIKVKDIAGNESAETTISITNIDDAAPILSASGEEIKEGETTVAVKVTITANEKIRLSTDQATLDGSGEENPNEGWSNKTDDGTVEKTFTKNGIQTVYVEDMVGNQANITIEVSGIEEKIESVEYLPSQDTMTNSNVYAIISANSELELPTGWEYAGLSDADVTDTSLGVDKTKIIKSFSENTNGDQQVQITTKSGKTLTATINIHNIDKVAPIAEVSYSTTARATEVTVILKDRNNEMLREKEGWSLSSDKKTLTKIYTENAVEQATITDLAGNESEPVEIRVANIDTEGLDVSLSYEKISNTSMKVIISSNKQLQTINGWTLSTDKLHLEKIYTSEVTNEEVIVHDIYGNQVILYITVEFGDTEAPDVEVISTTNADSSVTVTLRANEEIQRIDGWTLGSDRKSLTKTFTQSATENLQVKDLAGNSTSITVTVTIEVEEFEIQQVTYSTTLPTNSNVTATIKTNKELESVSGWTLSSDRKSISKEFTSNGTETVTLTSTDGETLQQPITVSNIDKVAPTASVNYQTGTNTVTATITANEAIQEVEGWQISTDKKKLTKSYSQNTNETVTIKDLAGNTTNVSIRIDTINPPQEDLSATVEYSTTVTTNKNVTVTITANKELTALSGWTLSQDKKVLTKEYSSNANDSVTITSVDGQTLTKEVIITNIDKTVPNIRINLVPSADNKSVTATITSDEEIQAVEGWTLSEDRKSMSKVYTESANEVIEVKDLAGNTSQATVTVTISGNNGGNGGGGNSGGDSGNNNGGNNGGSNNNNGGSGSNAGGSSGSKGSSSNVDDTTANSSIPKTGESFRNIGFILLGISLVAIVWTKIKKNNDIDE